MKSKYFFEEFKKEITEDHKKYKTRQESADLSTKKCDHKGKVKMIDGMLRCSCGAGWQGAQLNVLFDFFNKKD